ncbi:MAG: hypothetical protein MI863_25460 [Desulfobacterales bacterium]|nr:hypothetical protein [Desulfobacterales bacterium]
MITEKTPLRSYPLVSGTLDGVPAHIAVIDNQGHTAETNGVWWKFSSPAAGPGYVVLVDKPQVMAY